MTRRAVVGDARMIKDRSGKTTGNVTDAAIVGRRNMIVMLSNCRNTIMAGFAVADCAAMIENCAGETGCAVTNAAIFRGDDMRGRFRKGAECIVGATMARDTIRGDAGMIEYRRIECRRRVASMAVLARGYM